MAAAVEAHWPAGHALSGLVVTRYGHGEPGGHGGPHRGGGGEPPGPRRRRAGGRRAHPGHGAGVDRRRFSAVPDLGRRLLVAGVARAGRRAGGQAGGQPRAAAQWRRHPRHELRAQAPVGHQGRSPRRCRRPRAVGLAGRVRRARRRPVGHRIRAHHTGRHHPGGRPGRAGALRHRGACVRPGAAARPGGGDAQTRRRRVRSHPYHRHSNAPSLAGGRRGRGARRRDHPGDPG